MNKVCYVCRKPECNHEHSLQELIDFRNDPKWTAEEMRAGLQYLVKQDKENKLTEIKWKKDFITKEMMSKLSAEAFVSLLALVDAGKTIQIEKHFHGYEVTVWDDKTHLKHSHYGAEDLIKAIEKAKG